jgi:hypothetical protein
MMIVGVGVWVGPVSILAGNVAVSDVVRSWF